MGCCYSAADACEFLSPSHCAYFLRGMLQLAEIWVVTWCSSTADGEFLLP